MKLPRFLIISSLCLINALQALSCGPYNVMIDNPLKFHFYQDADSLTPAKEHKDENIKLWKALTSDKIPSSDVSTGVYKATYSQLEDWFNGKNCQNIFIKWINQHNASDLKEFLLLAKELEELRENRVSKWYYPSDKSGFDKSKNEQQKFERILAECKQHKSGRLADRYALQALRVLMSTGDYQGCINYYDSTLKFYPDTNLFKQMAKGYVAGCMYRLGDRERATELFAEAGNYCMLNYEDTDPEQYLKHLAYHNPESEAFKHRLNYLIGFGDDKANIKYIAIADAALSSPLVKHRGDWIYLKAYIEYVYNNNAVRALNLVRQALASSFSSSEMAKDAKFFEICMKAQKGDTSTFLADTKWIMESYGNTNGIWLYIIPALLKKGLTSEALLIATYETANDINETYRNGKMVNPYCNLVFQMLVSVKPVDVINFKNMLGKRAYGMTKEFIERCKPMFDDEYLNEIIGTLYMREGNYELAQSYLNKVSAKYQESVNVYYYLDYDPWIYCYSPPDKWYYPYMRYDYEYTIPLRPNTDFRPDRLSTPHDAKLNFAKEMARLQKEMKTASTSDQRELAKIKFAIGRYNSFNSCWALTQYWVGYASHTHYRLFHWLWTGDFFELDYLIDAPIQLEDLDKWFEEEVSSAIKSLKTSEAKAQAHLMLRNFKTIARHYPDTQAGQYLSTHCDNWKHWL